MTDILLSQGMTRPGIVQGQHWGLSIAETERIAARYRGSWLPAPISRETTDEVMPSFGITMAEAGDALYRAFRRRPTPRSHADPRLANRMER